KDAPRQAQPARRPGARAGRAHRVCVGAAADHAAAAGPQPAAELPARCPAAGSQTNQNLARYAHRGRARGTAQVLRAVVGNAAR
nr:hypothetical protein [Tanacetum cinerariifolium]